MLGYLLIILLLWPDSAHAAGAVVAAVVAAASASFATGATLATIAFAAIKSFAMSALTSALAPKQKKPSFSSGTAAYDQIRSSGATQSIRQPITERDIVYGEVRKSGTIVYASVTDDNKYIHFVITLASHEIQAIDEVIVDDISIPSDAIDGSGNVTSGRYANKILIKKYLGTTTQTYDTTLSSHAPEWTNAHRLQGIAYIYVRCEWDQDVFPQGAPNISAWIKGKKVYDPRTDTTKYTTCTPLFTRDYLIEDMGARVKEEFLDDASFETACNTSDQMISVTNKNYSFSAVDTTNDIITLSGNRLELLTGDKITVVSGTIGGFGAGDFFAIPYQRQGTPRIRVANSLDNAIAGIYVDLTSGGTGTIRKTAEPRYHGGGILKTNASPKENIEETLTAYSGNLIYAGGVWRSLAGEYQTPTLYFDESDLASGLKVKSLTSRRERFNRVQGVFTSPLYDGNPTDYPAVTNSTYETQDGEVIIRTLDQPFTQRPYHAMRNGKIALERMRQEITFEAKFKLTAFKAQVGDNIYFTFDQYGWDEKIFEVIEWSLETDDGVPVINMSLRENAPGVYDWASGEETAIDLAPNTSLPNWSNVTAVLGFSLDSILVNTKELDRVFSVLASWDAHTDLFVVNGGKYEVEYKETTESTYNSAGIVDGSVTQMILPTLKPDVLYDIRIFAYNNLGVKSAATTINNFQVGSTVTTNTEDWENESNARDLDDWEADALPSEDWE